jgi:hypothetical protein
MAGLALIDLKQGREQEAVERVEAILIYLEKDNLEGSDEPLRVYDICIQILKETGDDRWEEILQSAHERLQSWAALISDAGDRRAFLEHVPFHRRIEMTWEEYSKKAADPNIKNS